VLHTHFVQFLEEATEQLQRPMAHASNAAVRKWTDPVNRQSPRSVCCHCCVCAYQVKSKNSGNRGLGKGGADARYTGKASSVDWEY
jgi:hypothetical protein